MSQSNGFDLSFITDAKSRLCAVYLERGGETIHVDRVNLLDAGRREALADELAGRFPDLDRARLGRRLLEQCDAMRPAEDAGDDAVPSGDTAADKGPTPGEILLACCENVERFRANDVAYGTIDIDGHAVTMPLESRQFKTWLRGAYYKAVGKAARAEPVAETVGVLASQALFGKTSWPVYTRLAGYGESIVVDLGGDDHLAVVIDGAGWRVVDRAPVRFIRRRGMQALPVPVAGGDLAELRRLVNLADDADWSLTLAWLAAALRPTGPYPILEVTGEQGSAKSTFCKMLRALIDPNAAPLRAEPREARDLMIAATNGWLIGFDNLSDLWPWLSDALCRMATGGGFSTRALYTDDDECIFDAMRPVIVNGIADIATRPDLSDRAVRLSLPVIPVENRRTEREIWAAFHDARPRVLGALLDAVSVGLRRIDSVKLDNLPRMADFAEWATACEPGLGLGDGAFLEAYAANRRSAVDAAVEAATIGPALRALVEARGDFSGTAADLLAALADPALVNEAQRRARDWPATPRKLGADLRRLAPVLRAVGIDVRFLERQGHGRRRLLRVCWVGETSAASAAQAAIGRGAIENADLVRTVSPPGGGGTSSAPGETSSAVGGTSSAPGIHRPQQNGDCTLETRFADGADGADGLYATFAPPATEYDPDQDG